MTARIWLAVSPLVLWAPIAPVLGVLLLGLVGWEVAHRTQTGDRVLGHQAWPWLVRAVLAILFIVSLVDLVRDTVTLL